MEGFFCIVNWYLKLWNILVFMPHICCVIFCFIWFWCDASVDIVSGVLVAHLSHEFVYPVLPLLPLCVRCQWIVFINGQVRSVCNLIFVDDVAVYYYFLLATAYITGYTILLLVLEIYFIEIININIRYKNIRTYYPYLISF